MVSCLKMRKNSKPHETSFMKNGRLLLEELIASCEGKCNPIRTFSVNELKKATNNYDRRLRILTDSDCEMYEGFLEDRKISVKKYDVFGGWGLIGSPITDIVIGSQMSIHNNVLKLIGCCLETILPILVYEYAGNETLSKYTNGKFQLPSWKCRIKILVDIANAVAYLHTALSRPVIHRDIRPANIIVDKNYVAKLTDFSLSISIPDGQSHVEDVVRGRMGFGAPEYIATGYVTEKVDVYNFGIFVLKVSTGRETLYDEAGDWHSLQDHVKDYVENRKQLIEILHPNMLKEGIELQGLQDLAKLALCCICSEAEDRPTMIEVGRELRRIHQYVLPC